MNIEELREFCLSVKGATESFPFAKFARGAENVLVFKVMDKMFAYIDLYPSDGFLRVWLKNEAEQVEQLLLNYTGIVRSTRNPERHWIGVLLDSDVPDPLIEDLIRQSVNSVVKSLSKKRQQEYEALDGIATK